MALTVKVSISEAWNDDGKGWVAEVKDFNITANAKTFEKTIEQIQPKIEEYLQRMFGTKKRVMASVGQAMGKVEFEIDVLKDRTLDQYQIQKPSMEKIVETAKTIVEISNATGIPQSEVLEKAKLKLKKTKEPLNV